MNSSPARGRPVLAAIDDSALAVPVARRAGRIAAQLHRPLLLLTAVPYRMPVGATGEDLAAQAHLLRGEAEAIAARVRPALAVLGLHPRLIVRPYRDRGGPRRTAQRIAAELVRAAAEHDAHTLVLGLPERIGPTGAGVISRVTRTAPPDIQLAFAVPTVQPGRPRLGSVDVPAARLLQVPQPPGRIALSPLGRRILADREYRLRALALPRQRAALKTGDTERRLDGYERLVAEQRRLRRLLATAASTTDRPADPRIAEIGDHVTLRAEDGRRRRILLVEDFEASFNPLGVSVDSPLGRALLGRHVGERVSLPDGRRVDPPAGTARILTCRRG